MQGLVDYGSSDEDTLNPPVKESESLLGMDDEFPFLTIQHQAPLKAQHIESQPQESHSSMSKCQRPYLLLTWPQMALTRSD